MCRQGPLLCWNSTVYLGGVSHGQQGLADRPDARARTAHKTNWPYALPDAAVVARYNRCFDLALICTEAVMSIVDVEQVLVVPTEEFHKLGYFQGVSTDVEHYLKRLLDPTLVSYRPRSEMEQDPSFKQLIPYVIFQHDDAEGARRVFCYTRGAGQGEARLHLKRSIGIGGHISLEDAGHGSTNPYHEGMRRELAEEVIIETEYTDRCVGMINDDETDVGKVHLGIVHVFEVKTSDVRPREAELQETGFRTLQELRELADTMESWSRICLEAIYPE